MSQLQTYYTDYADVLEESTFKYELIGLNLLCLLALSRNAEFHVSVEKLPADVLQKNIYIKHPVQLEQFIMEGNYNKVISIYRLAHISRQPHKKVNLFLGDPHERQRPVEVLHVLH